MRKVSFILSFAAFVAVWMSVQSCKKEENQAPVLTITEPGSGAVIFLPDSVHIEGVASDDQELHEMIIEVKNHMDSVVFAEYPYVHELKSYNFHTHFVTTDTGMYHLKISVADHDEGVTTRELMFTVKP